MEVPAVVLRTELRVHPMNHEHPLGERFPNGDGFIDAVPSLIAELPARLGLRASALDGSVDGLTRFDRAARRIGGQACLDDSNILGGLVAYVGEVIRNVAGGDWVIDNNPGEPWQAVIAGAGRRYPIFLIFGEILEGGSMAAFVAVHTGCDQPGFVRRRSGVFAAREQAVAAARGALATVPDDSYRVTQRYGDGAPSAVQFDRDIEIDGYPFAAHAAAYFTRNGDIIGGILSRPTTFQDLTFPAGSSVGFFSNHRDGRLGDCIVLGADQELFGVPCKAGTLTQFRLHKGRPYLTAGTLSRDHRFAGTLYRAGSWFSVDRQGHLMDFRPPGWDTGEV